MNYLIKFLFMRIHTGHLIIVSWVIGAASVIYHMNVSFSG